MKKFHHQIMKVDAYLLFIAYCPLPIPYSLFPNLSKLLTYRGVEQI